MNSHEVDEQMALISQYYPDHAGIITHFVQAEQAGAAVSSKPRRRRRKNKGAEGGGDGAALRKRKLSDEQVNMLEKTFGSEHKLESERKEKLAAELGLDPRQVAVWFQNRRARWKSKKLEDEYNKLRAEHDTTVLEKCRLETQLLKLKEQLQEAETEIQRLCSDGFTSNSSPSSSVLSMDQTPFLGLQNVFCANAGLEWDNLYYM